jgi:regulatory protein
MPGRGAAKALAYALKLLGYRQRSESELKERLAQKGFSPEDAVSALSLLKEQGYVDDSATARALRDHAERVKLLGRTGARMFMRKRGIRGEVAEEALEDYDEEAAALKLLERKSRSLEGRPGHVVRRRLAGYLGRRGYSSEVARRLLKKTLEGTGDPGDD